MASGRLLVPAWSRALDSDGEPISARISLFLTGTDSLASVYSDEGLTVPLQNPVLSNSAGRFPAIWASDTVTYDWSVEAPYGPPGSPFTGTGLTTALAADVLAADAAEAAADAAAISETNAAASEATAQDILDDINNIILTSGTVAGLAGRLLLNGSNIGANGPAFRTATGTVGSVALAAGTGSTLVGSTDAGTGAVPRTLAAWLQDLPALPKGYGALINGATDDTAALNAALATGRQISFTGRMYINGVVNLPDKFEITGAGPEQSVIALGPLGQLKMTGTSYDVRIGFGTFKDVGIAMVDSITSVSTPGVLIEKSEQVTFDNCVFYHTLTRLDATAGIAFSRCRFFGGITGSKLVSQTSYQPGGGQGISEYPTFTDCDFSGHPVDLIDTVDATFHICRMLAGDYGIKSRRLNATGSGGQEFSMGPVIDLCTFDSIDGLSIDVEYGGTTSRITNSFISSGRVGGVSGVRLDHCVGMTVSGNRFEWCGVRAIVMTACQGVEIVANNFVNQAAGSAVWIAGASSGIVISGNTFLNIPLWGGSGSGATLLAIETPASDLSNSLISNNYISGMTDAGVAYIAGTNNQVFGNMGWNFGGYLNDVGLRLNNTQVVGVRNTGWTAATGTGSKGAFAAAAAGTANAAYVQADFQTALNRIAALEARVKSYDDALRGHGLIGS